MFMPRKNKTLVMMMNFIVTFAFVPCLFVVFGCDMTGLSRDPAKRLIKKRCSACHTTKRIYQARRSPDEWQKIVARMIRHGAQLNGEEKAQILDYLEKNQGDLSAPTEKR